MNKEQRKCHNCKGTGKVENKKNSGQCYYCNGKGHRTSIYGKDEN